MDTGDPGASGRRADGRPEARFLSLHARHGSEVISVMGRDNDLLYESDSIERLLGYRHAEEASARGDWIGRVHPEDRAALARAIEGCMATPGEHPPAEYRIRDADGGWRWLESRGVNLLDNPEIGGVVVSTRDVTDRKRAEEALAESERRLRAVAEGAPVILFAFDASGTITFDAGRGLSALGLAPGSTVGLSAFDIYEDDPRVLGNLRKALAGEEVADTVELAGNSGGKLFFDTLYSPLRDAAGEVEGVVGVATDVTERKRLEERLKHQALHDPLTGLPGRALLTDRLAEALARARRDGGSAAVLFVDVDDLKLVNDSLGHEAGDRLLRGLGWRLRGCVRGEDTVSRFGGDEFVVLLGGTASEEEALHAARRILKGLGEPLYIDGYQVPVTVSVGVAVGPSPGESAGDLIRHADAAMYRAKAQPRARGGGGYATFDPRMDRGDLEKLELSGDLRRAVERGEMSVHYQHKVDLVTGGVAGWEALLRWEHPERGQIPPETFVPLAEETGLIVPIGRWVLQKACEQARVWRERYPKEPGQFMSVNLSARQFADPALEEEIARVLRRTGLPAEALDLEITERVLVEEEVADFARIRHLKELGLSFSLDDFGTGYSSLLSLKQLPVDFIKVDRSFVEGVPGAPADEAFVTAMVDLARALGLGVVAEGIEGEAQWRRLRELGCDYGQGYHFAPPLPAGEASRAMERLEGRRGDRAAGA